MTRLYIAGVISGDPRPYEEKRDAFYHWAGVLQKRGYVTINPLDVGNDLCRLGPGACKQASAKVLAGSDQGAGHSWECYLRHDLIEMLACDGVALIPNWHLSPGARMEFATATAIGLPAKPADEWEPEGSPLLKVTSTRVPVQGGTLVFSEQGMGIEVDDNQRPVQVYCAGCSALESEHEPGGIRFGRCPFFGPGTASICTQCESSVKWDGVQWTDSQSAVCAASTQPDVKHEVSL